MQSYVYIVNNDVLSVGFYAPDKVFHIDSDYQIDDISAARARVSFLNGSGNISQRYMIEGIYSNKSKKAAPAPARKATPAPVRKAAPAPVRKAAPAPARKAAPAPARKAAPAPKNKKGV